MSLFLSNVFLAKLAPKIPRNTHKIGCFFSKSVSENSAKFDVFFPRPIRSPATWVKEKWAISPVSFQNCFSVPWLRYSAVWPNVIKYFLFSLWTAWFTMLIKKAKVLFLLNLYAPINVNPVGGSVGKGWGFDKFWNFWIKFPRVGNERSIKSVKKAPTPGEKI